ncbi:MAG TPA: ABC transporter ATP-binding protein [Pyrinomonadaceae bacterium]|nr:ABC transporter ATP-binding protein [Pyrinomonadaceae bacterium]
MTAALRVENISKQYRIYAKPGDRLKESLTRGRMKRHREFWALKDVSFEIEKGTTTGIIGPNGSGKSTLLQIITGTLEPTHGSVWYDGRIAALLELGAGFDPEFTGIENIYMNASLMGFSRRETDALLPDIERFAEIGDFIHQPVKTYSSGMYVRLAFSIAVHSNPEILVIDEALAVGDTIFQHRCVRRIKEMQARGITVFFVSHEPTLVRALCHRAILLYRGEMVADGLPLDVLNRYQRLIMAREAGENSESSTQPHDRQPPTVEGFREPALALAKEAAGAPLSYEFRHGNGDAQVIYAELLDSDMQPVELVDSGRRVYLKMRFVFRRDVVRPVCGFMIRSRHGINIYGTNTEQQNVELGAAKRGDVIEATFAFNCWLGQEHYFISVAVHSPEGVAYDWLDGVIFFRVACEVEMEGLANLCASITASRVVTDDVVTSAS